MLLLQVTMGLRQVQVHVWLHVCALFGVLSYVYTIQDSVSLPTCKIPWLGMNRSGRELEHKATIICSSSDSCSYLVTSFFFGSVPCSHCPEE